MKTAIARRDQMQSDRTVLFTVSAALSAATLMSFALSLMMLPTVWSVERSVDWDMFWSSADWI